MKFKNSLFGKGAKVLFGLCFILTYGCINVEYSGTDYPPTENVEVLDVKTVPDGYVAIGKATAKASSEQYSKDEIIQKLVKKAKAEGADAIFISSFEKVPAGRARLDETNNTAQGDENLGWGLDDNFVGDIRQIDYDFVETEKAEKTVQTYDTIIKAVFLRKKQ